MYLAAATIVGIASDAVAAVRVFRNARRGQLRWLVILRKKALLRFIHGPHARDHEGTVRAGPEDVLPPSP